MKYCIECGTKLIAKELKNEGIIPYCEQCKQYRFPLYNVAVSIIVMNQLQNKILLIQQYGREEFILVAGYVNKRETPEHAVKRELKEEIGLKVKEIIYNRSEYYEPSNTLMLNYSCVVEDETFFINEDEVDYAEWLTVEQARNSIKKDSLAQKFLETFVEEQNEKRKRVNHDWFLKM